VNLSEFIDLSAFMESLLTKVFLSGIGGSIFADFVGVGFAGVVGVIEDSSGKSVEDGDFCRGERSRSEPGGVENSATL